MTKPTVFLGNIRIEQQVNLNNGFYKFKYNDVNNPFELLNGVVEVKDRKITAIVGYKEYDRLWTNGLSSCLLDINHIVESQNISRIDSTNNSFLGYAGFRYSPSKVYSQLSCKTNNDGIAIMTISWSINKNVNLDNQDISKIDTKLIDNNKWLPDYNGLRYSPRHITENKKYSFLNYSLGDKLSNIKNTYIIHGGEKYYPVMTDSFEKNTSLKFLKTINEENDKLDAESIASILLGNVEYQETKKRNEQKKKWNYIYPDRVYVTLSDDDQVNGIYIRDVIFKDYNDRKEDIPMALCLLKMKGYAEYIHENHSIIGELKFLVSKSEINGDMIESKPSKILEYLNKIKDDIFGKDYQLEEMKNQIVEQGMFKLFDKTNNINIQLSCKDNNLYNGAYMTIEFKKQ